MITSQVKKTRGEGERGRGGEGERGRGGEGERGRGGEGERERGREGRGRGKGRHVEERKMGVGYHAECCCQSFCFCGSELKVVRGIEADTRIRMRINFVDGVIVSK